MDNFKCLFQRGHKRCILQPLLYSCKRRHFCPSCHAKRCVQFGEFACSNVLKNVLHRHFVFSIPKIIRIYFLFNRALLKDLAKIAWEVLSCYYKNSVSKEGTTPAAICSIQTFGDMLGFNPHLHILAADGVFGNSIFYASAADSFDDYGRNDYMDCGYEDF